VLVISGNEMQKDAEKIYFMNQSLKILPYGQNILNAWPEECFLFSLMNSIPNGINWVMDSVIQLSMYTSSDVPQGLVSFDPFVKHHQLINGMDFNPFITKYHIDKKLLNSFCDDFDKIIINAINNDYYISTMFDMRILLQCNTKEKFHASYIYGYDLDNNVYHLNDNFYNGKNSKEQFSFTLVKKAYKACLGEKFVDLGNTAVCFYKIRENINYDFSNEKLKGNIKRFLNSIPSQTNCDSAYVWGISILEYMRESISNIGNQKIDIRNFAFLLDYANLNCRRVEFLIQRNKIINALKILEEIKKQYRQCSILLQLCIKYNITGRKEIIDNIVKNLDDFYFTEKKVLENLCELI